MPGHTEETLEAIGHMEPEGQSPRATSELSGERPGGLRLNQYSSHKVDRRGSGPFTACALQGGKESLRIFGIKN